MKKSKKLIVISILFVVLTMLVYAERVKIRTIQHKPVGGFVKFETLGNTTLVDVTVGKKASSNGIVIKLTDDMYVGSTDSVVVTAKSLIVHSSMTVSGNVEANSSFNITGSSTFIGNTNFNAGLTVSNDVRVVDNFTATTIVGSSLSKGLEPREFKIRELEIPTTAFGASKIPLPGLPGPLETTTKWRSVTYTTSGGTIDVTGAESVFLGNITDWSNDLNDCEGNHNTMIADVSAFCSGKPENYECTDRYKSSEPVAEIGFYSDEEVEFYHPEENCAGTLYNRCPTHAAIRFTKEFDYINGGCPETYKQGAYNCENFCEMVYPFGACDLNKFYLYANQSGNIVYNQDVGDLWYDPVHWYLLLSIGSATSHSDKVYVNIDREPVSPNCAVMNVLIYDYKVMKCFPKRKNPMERKIVCNVPQGENEPIIVLGWD